MSSERGGLGRAPRSPGSAFPSRAPAARACCRSAIVVALGLLACGFAAGAQTSIVELDRIVAIVNEDVIVYSELLDRMRTIRGKLEASGTLLPPEHVFARQVLDQLIRERIQLQLAAESGLRVDDETLNQSVAELAARNELTLKEFRDILERDGFDFAKFREEIRAEILISQVRQRFVNSRITVSPRDIDNHLATLEKQGATDSEYRLGHILVAVPEGASPEQIAESKARAQELHAQLRSGTDFAQTAVASSDGQQALQGGDLGWRKAVELPTIFADAVPKMSVGDISEPIRSSSGFHLIRLLDIRGGEKHVITQTRARHILLRPNELLSEEEAASRLSQLRARIVNGDDFGELARAHSADAGSTMKGGDLGWANPGDLLPSFERVMDSLADAETSEPFKTQFGWHIIQVVERRDYDGTEEVRRANAIQQIRRRKLDEELSSWLRQIREEAYIEYRVEQ